MILFVIVIFSIFLAVSSKSVNYQIQYRSQNWFLKTVYNIAAKISVLDCLLIPRKPILYALAVEALLYMSSLPWQEHLFV
jgi:hypothetical protein